MTQSTSVAVKQPEALALPAELNSLINEIGGLVQVRSNLLKPIRIKLVQAMSVAQGELGKVGDFVCETTGQNFGKQLTVIPLMLKESASLMYSVNNKPRILPVGDEPADGAPVCYTKDLIRNKDDYSCKLCPWGEYWADWKDGQAPKCKQSIDMFCIPEGSSNIMLLSFRKTSYAAGKNLVNQVVGAGKAPFLHKYTFKSKDATQEKYRYKIIDPAAISKVQLTQEELMNYTSIIADFLNKQKEKAIDYDVTHNDEDESSIREAAAMPI